MSIGKINIVEMSYVKQIASPGSMQDTGCSELVHWDDPEGWMGREVGVGHHFTAVPAKHSLCSLPWTRGIFSPLPLLSLNMQ